MARRIDVSPKGLRHDYRTQSPNGCWINFTKPKTHRRWPRMSEAKRAPYNALAERPPSSISLESYHTTSDCTQEDENPAVLLPPPPLRSFLIIYCRFMRDMAWRVDIPRNGLRHGYQVFLTKVSRGYRTRFCERTWHEFIQLKIARRWHRISEEERAPYKALVKIRLSSISIESYHSREEGGAVEEDANVPPDDEIIDISSDGPPAGGVPEEEVAADSEGGTSEAEADPAVEPGGGWTFVGTLTLMFRRG
ncbi:hypothetical protein FRC08_015953 [Ceratobasidium sp. 394]|nr:hypothetical protein FRC08_015953 [Ceratobasidium sp. 394]